MKQFKLWFCSLLLLVANVANSQTSESTTPDVEELTDGILAFTCEGTDEEFPAIFINDNSKWTMVDDTDFDLITEIDNGFKIQSSKFPDMLAYFQDTGSYWEYNELSEDGPSKTICRDEDEFLEQVTMAIAPKITDNIEAIKMNLVLKTAALTALQDESAAIRAAHKMLALELSRVYKDYPPLFLDNILKLSQSERFAAIAESKLGTQEANYNIVVKVCVKTLKESAKYGNGCKTVLANFLSR
jgi:hypothetical protein